MRFTFCILLILIVIRTSSQIEVGFLQTAIDKNFKVLSLGDSILVSYLFKRTGARVTSILDKNGNVSNIDLPPLSNQDIVSATNSRDSITIYFFEHNDYSMLNAIAIHRSTFLKTHYRSISNIKGVLLSIITEGNALYLISYLPTSREIQIKQIKNSTQAKERTFKAAIVANLDGLNVASFMAGSFISPRTAQSPVKIIKQGSHFYLQELIIGSTYVYDLNFEDGTKKHTTFSEYPTNFSTLLFNNYLLKLEKKGGFHITIYDRFDNHVINTFSITRRNPIIKESSFLRDDNAKRILKDRNVWDAISNVGDPFIAAYQLDSANFVLKIGTHQVTDKTGVPLITGFGVIVGMVSAVARMATMQEGGDIGHYFYLKGNAITGFEYYSDDSLLDIRMDNFEINLVPKAKTYIHGVRSSYAFYDDQGQVRIVRFDW